MASINFVWSDLGINETKFQFNFSDIKIRNSEKKALNCARIIPPAQIDGKLYNYIHFTRFIFKDSILSLEIMDFGAHDIFLDETMYVVEICSPSK